MLKHLPLIFILTTTFFLSSCRDAQQTAYKKDTLLCLNELFTSQKNGAQATIAVTEKYKDRFTFAHDLQEKISDKYCIEQIEELVSSGKYREAQERLNNQIVKRGYTQALSQSNETLKAATIISRYNRTASSLPLSESSREFSRLINNTSQFKNNLRFKNWLNSQEKAITQRAINEKKRLTESLEQALNTSVISRPDLTEIILLQKAVYDKKKILPNLESIVSSKLHDYISKVGSAGAIDQHYIIDKAPTQLKKSPSTLVDTYKNINYYASKGKTVETIKALQETTGLIEIDKNLRKSTLKQLLNAKGWNNASLINENVLDISYLLETFYLAND